MINMIYEWTITHGSIIAITCSILCVMSEIHYRYSHYRINKILHENRQDCIKAINEEKEK